MNGGDKVVVWTVLVIAFTLGSMFQPTPWTIFWVYLVTVLALLGFELLDYWKGH